MTKRFDIGATTLRVGSVARRRRRLIGLALVGLVSVAIGFVPTWALAQSPDWSWGMHPMSWMWGAWGLGMMAMMFVFWGLVITGVVLGIKWLARTAGSAPGDRALEILRERYARGEINKEEFDSKQRDLR